MNERPEPAERRFTPAELVSRIRAGDAAAEDELVARYGRGVSFILRRVAGARTAADDLYQEVLLLAIVKIRRGELREPERLSGFICALARNLAIDYCRRHDAGQAAEPRGDTELLPAASPSPLEQVLRLEDIRLVRKVLAELPSSRDREVLHRFYVGEEDKEPICRDLNLTSLQFNRVIHRARERFRELFQKTARRGTGATTG